jgi:hypothetical protein
MYSKKRPDVLEGPEMRKSCWYELRQLEYCLYSNLDLFVLSLLNVSAILTLKFDKPTLLQTLQHKTTPLEESAILLVSLITNLVLVVQNCI